MPEPSTVVFFHAHPDDEAIFTGGTMRLLADRGDRVVLVVATRGERGEREPGDSLELGHRREGETRAAAARLGVSSVHFLGYADSGVDVGALDPRADGLNGPNEPDGSADEPGAFAAAPVDEAAARLAPILAAERADAIVIYDETGIYGHPDHLGVHLVGCRAAELAGIATRYDATVDREYLHFVETHLVEEAGQSVRVPVGPLDETDAPFAPSLEGDDGDGRGRGALGLAGTALGMPSVLIDCIVDARPVLSAKREAMLAHASQIPESSSALRLSASAFAEVYGFEWYLRTGPPGPIDRLARP